MSNGIDASNQVTDLLRELIAWTRLQALPRFTQLLDAELNDDKKRLVYEYSDGSRGRREVAKLADVPDPTVQHWWDRWFNLGIMKASQQRAGRMARLCSLKDVGIDVPKRIQNSKEPKAASAQPERAEE
jgi:hypothetical protein